MDRYSTRMILTSFFACGILCGSITHAAGPNEDQNGSLPRRVSPVVNEAMQLESFDRTPDQPPRKMQKLSTSRSNITDKESVEEADYISKPGVNKSKRKRTNDDKPDSQALVLQAARRLTGFTSEKDASIWLDKVAYSGLSLPYFDKEDPNTLLKHMQIANDFAQAAEGGNIHALIVLIRMQCAHWDINNAFSEGVVRLCRRAANSGSQLAQYALGVLNYNGYGVMENKELAVEWYTKATHADHMRVHARSLVNLGTCYAMGDGVAKNCEMAMELYTRAEKEGDFVAMELLGDMFLLGRGVLKSIDTAREKYRMAAQAGGSIALSKLVQTYIDAEDTTDDNFRVLLEDLEIAASNGSPYAHLQLGMMYTYKRGVDRDYRKAYGHFLAASRIGHAVAQYELGLMFEENRDVQQSYENAFYWYEKSAEQGYHRAQLGLGHLYEHGFGVNKKDYRKAHDCYAKAASSGNHIAMCNLGLLSLHGRGVDLNMETAFYWFRKAADCGYSRAQYILGDMYEEDENYSQAYECYLQSAKSGNSRAQFALGRLYGRGHGVAQDYKAAYDWLMKAYNNGCMESIYNIGDFHMQGLGVPKNHAKGIEWFEKGIDHGCLSCLTALGSANEAGIGVEKNISQAIDYYTQAAEENYDPAMTNLGMLYHKGLGVEQDYQLAHFYLLKAAEQGYHRAQFRLGLLLFDTGNPKRNDAQGFDWIKKSAENGNCVAQFELYHLYINGRGCSISLREGFYWLLRASENGFESARRELRRQLMDRNNPVPVASSGMSPTPLDQLTEILEQSEYYLGLYIGRTASYAQWSDSEPDEFYAPRLLRVKDLVAKCLKGVQALKRPGFLMSIHLRSDFLFYNAYFHPYNFTCIHGPRDSELIDGNQLHKALFELASSRDIDACIDHANSVKNYLLRNHEAYAHSISNLDEIVKNLTTEKCNLEHFVHTFSSILCMVLASGIAFF